MDYEKRYKEAREIARKINSGEAVDTSPGWSTMELIFPELRESEDEKNWKAVLEYIKDDSLRSWLEKQKEQKPVLSDEAIRDGVVHFGITQYQIDNWLKKHINIVEQKPAVKQDYSDLTDLERVIHRGFLCAGVENVPITIIKETAWECLAQMNPAEWNDTDMKEARDSLISVCRDWERGQKTTLLPVAAIRARYFLEHLTEPKPAEWSEEDERILKGIIGLVDHDQHYGVSNKEMLAWLKSLRPVSKESLQPHWKPSEEQISSLKQARDYYINGHIKYVGRHLSEIAEQLEKLM